MTSIHHKFGACEVGRSWQSPKSRSRRHDNLLALVSKQAHQSFLFLFKNEATGCSCNSSLECEQQPSIFKKLPTRLLINYSPVIRTVQYQAAYGYNDGTLRTCLEPVQQKNNICLFANKSDKMTASDKMYRGSCYQSRTQGLRPSVKIKILQRRNEKKFLFSYKTGQKCKLEHEPSGKARKTKCTQWHSAASFQLTRVVANATLQSICNSLLIASIW